MPIGLNMGDAELLPCETPLVELLEQVPANARLKYEHEGTNCTSYIPVGDLCQRVAAELRTRIRSVPDEGLRERIKDVVYRMLPLTSSRVAEGWTDEILNALTAVAAMPKAVDEKLVERLRGVITDAETMGIGDDEILNWPDPWDAEGEPDLTIGDLREALSQVEGRK